MSAAMKGQRAMLIKRAMKCPMDAGGIFSSMHPWQGDVQFEPVI